MLNVWVLVRLRMWRISYSVCSQRRSGEKQRTPAVGEGGGSLMLQVAGDEVVDDGVA